VETVRVLDAGTAGSSYEGYVERVLEVETQPEMATLPAGIFGVDAGQPNVAILFELMEPDGADSFAATGWLNAAIRPGATLPIMRLKEWPAVPAESAR
jgi:hypothetical protein